MRKWKQDEAVQMQLCCLQPMRKTAEGRERSAERRLPAGMSDVWRILAQWMEQKSDLTCVRHAIWS